MADKSRIDWCDATWNPTIGCSKTSRGCEHCYAIQVAHSLDVTFHNADYHGLTVQHADGSLNWSGEVRTLDEHRLLMPYKWKASRRIFVDSMSDLFHDQVSDDTIERVWHVMADNAHHTFMVLTKRPQRMQAWLERHAGTRWGGRGAVVSPVPNVWVGASAEDQDAADARRDSLYGSLAALHFWSLEPLLGPIDLGLRPYRMPDWVIVGGESGPGWRPMDLSWVRDIRDQCVPLRIPFFFKQQAGPRPGMEAILDGAIHHEFPYREIHTIRRGTIHAGSFRSSALRQSDLFDG